MSHVASLRVAMLALTTCACAFAVLPWSTQAAPVAAACAAAPKPAAPEGRHWRYHLDRATNSKCWYLAAQGARKTRSAAMVAQTAPEPQVRIPAPPLSAGGIKHLTAPLEDAPAQAPAAAPPGNAPATDAAPAEAAVEAAPAPVATAPTAAADQPQRVDNDAPPDAQSTALAAPPPVQAPAEPVVAPKRSAAPRVDADPMTMLPLALGALAAALLAAGAILFASGNRRRRDTIVRIVDLNARPRLPKGPNLAGWSALSDGAHDHDDAAEEVQRRVAPARRRQAA